MQDQPEAQKTGAGDPDPDRPQPVESDPTDPRTRSRRAIVPADFVVPLDLATANTTLRPLGPEHNRSDYAAWTSSIAHIQTTPGFSQKHSWPSKALTLEENLQDLIRHRQDFSDRIGFTYTVLDAREPRGGEDPESTVVGCVYIYADDTGTHDVDVRSWVVAHRPELDVEVWAAVSRWLAEDWPFTSVRYADRPAD